VTPLAQDTLAQVWTEVLAQIGPLLARELERGGLPAIIGPNRLVLQFSPAYNQQREQCNDPVRISRVLDVLKRVTGETWDLRLETAASRNGHGEQEAPAISAAPAQPTALQHPLVQSTVEMLGAKLLQVDDGFGHVEPIADDDEVDAQPTDDPEE
jgi:hypothetical protein